MEDKKELRLELLRYLNKDAITLNDVCIPDYQSKRFSSTEIRVCLDFFVANNLLIKHPLSTRYADLTLQGDAYLKELEMEKSGWLKRNLKSIVTLIVAQFVLALFVGLIVLGIEYFVILNFSISFK